MPGLGYRPEVWLLGSSTYSAQLAGLLGLPFSFAHHFAPAGTLDAVQAYRSSFEPSARLEAPHLMVGVAVICADTAEEARWLAGPGALAILRLRSGHPGRYPTPQEAADYRYTPHERETVRAWTASHVVGDPDQVRARIDELVDRTGADELIVTTMTHGHRERIRSYELVAAAFGLVAPDPRPVPAGEPVVR